MSIRNINEYQQDIFEKKFKKTNLYKRLSNDFDLVDFSKLWVPRKYTTTPRQEVGDRTFKETIFSAVPFYYLEFLINKQPEVIYDLGCGWNIFKKYIPNIVGVGAEPPDCPGYYGDIHDFVDDDYINGHQNYFDSVFSINALHFIPLSDLKKRVQDFYSMLKPNGIGWLSLNLQRMLDRDQIKFHDKDTNFLDAYIRESIGKIGIEYKVFDIDLDVKDEYMNGNIRLVMQKVI